MFSKAIGTDYYIDDWDWSNSIENTLKIKDNNNSKDFQILNIRNNWYFNLKKSQLKRDLTDTDNKKLAQWDLCEEEGSTFHCLTLCKKVRIIWDYIFNILKSSGFKFKDIPPSNIFFNSLGSPNSFPFLKVLNTKIFIYWSKCNNIPLSLKVVKKTCTYS